MKISRRNFSYGEIYRAVRKGEKFEIERSDLAFLASRRELVNQVLESERAVYGVNTGFGAFKDVRIDSGNLAALQKNLILSHACGIGNPFSLAIVRTMMILMAIYLSKGFSGVRPDVVQKLVEMLNKGVVPIVPEKGSVGSSGDLAPSAHVALVLIGRGEAFFEGRRMSGRKALERAGIWPLVLDAKEGLALINNTAAMTACAVVALGLSLCLADIADVAGALSAEALRATHKAFDARIHRLKAYQGQIIVARRLRELLAGSTIVDEKRVQDQYSVRCIPQVHGAIREAINFAGKIVTTEINSVTDNPLGFSHGGKVEFLSGGNFHGEAVAIAMDTLRLAVCEFANISDRRICSLLDSNHNFGLPPFLSCDRGICSGLMILQYTTASLVSENKILAHPAVVDSIPTSANIEDLVSMGTISARKTLEVLGNVKQVLAIELLVNCQALDFRLKEGYSLAKRAEKVYKGVRKAVPFFTNDTEYMPYVAKIASMIDREEIYFE